MRLHQSRSEIRAENDMLFSARLPWGLEMRSSFSEFCEVARYGMLFISCNKQSISFAPVSFLNKSVVFVYLLQEGGRAFWSPRPRGVLHVNIVNSELFPARIIPC